MNMNNDEIINMNTDKFEELHQQMSLFCDKCLQLRSQADKNVSKWLWATGSYFSNIPFEQERDQISKGKLLKGVPKSLKDAYEFGFDSEEHLLIFRTYNSSGTVDSEVFTLYEKDKILTYYYLCLPNPELVRVDKITYEKGFPNRLISLGHRGDKRLEEYQYNDSGLISSIYVERQMRSRKLPLIYTYEFTYEASGTGHVTRVEASGNRKLSFDFNSVASPAGKSTVTAILKQFETELAKAIYDVVRTFYTDKVVYCLALNYENDPGSSRIPTIGLGLADESEGILIPEGKIPDTEEWLWNPAEFSTHGDPQLQVRSIDVKDLDRKLRSYYIQGEDIDFRAVYNRVAAKLNKLDWSPLPIARDFIVYAVDNDLVDLNENFALARASTRNP
jgi:hypothetical protein